MCLCVCLCVCSSHSSGADRLEDQQDSSEETASAVPEQDFGLSGKLAAETNTYRVSRW